MDKEFAKRKIVELIDDINYHNKLYYSESSPIISDQDYDLLKNEIINIEKKYKYLRNNLSPSIAVGFKPSKNFIKSRHRVQMLSLSNAFNEEDLINFEKKIINYLKDDIKFEYSVEPKIDGISASLTYIDGILEAGR